MYNSFVLPNVNALAANIFVYIQLILSCFYGLHISKKGKGILSQLFMWQKFQKQSKSLTMMHNCKDGNVKLITFYITSKNGKYMDNTES